MKRIIKINKYFSVLIIFLLLNMPSFGMSKTLPAGVGANLPPNILIIIDTSGSMTWDTGGDATEGDGGIRYRGSDTDNSNNTQNSSNYYNTAVLGYPSNDSRLYIAKHVIWDIMRDSELTQGVRYGFMAYPQDEFDTLQADVLGQYDENLTDTTDDSYYNWSSCDSAARLLVSVNEANLTASQIISWVDGDESYPTNKELRADGATPIAGSLNTAWNYYAGSGFTTPIQQLCQRSYVILITDGEETCGGAPVTAARNLRSSAAGTLPDPGTFTYNGNSYDIKTYVIGFGSDTEGSPTLNSMARAGGTAKNALGAPDLTNGTAYSAADFTQLKQALRTVINAIRADNLTATAPVIMPRMDSNSRYFYMTKFRPKDVYQWEGQLLSYRINNTTGFPVADPEWDAGEILGGIYQTRSTYGTLDSDGRSIWTADSAITDTSINNFRLINRGSLKPLLGYGSDTNDTNTDRLINFVRGKDAFDENINNNINEERWKLADIYHSTPIEVRGPANYYIDNNYPTFKNDYRSRNLMLYAGSNGGMLHAFSVSNGYERWAFIPPDLLGKLRNMVSATPNQSISQYYVDMPPIVDDVYINGPGGIRWRTVLIGGERQGDHGLFALDVTNPDSPVFLWNISNNLSISTINYWQSNGTLNSYNYTDYANANPEYRDYRGLGETWSVPVIGRLKADNSDVFALFFGGGYDNVNAGVGNKVFVSRVENGAILKSFDLEDSAGDGIKNMAASTPALLFEDATGKSYIQFMYIGDQEGQMWKMDVRSTNSSDWTNCIFFDANAGSTNERYINTSPELSYDDGKRLWVYFGTGDIYNPEKVTTTMDNMFFAIRDNNVRLYNSSSSGDCPSPQITFSDLTDVSAAGAGIGEDRKGWYVDLQRGNGEKVMGSMVWGGVIFFTTYVPNSNACDSGDAYLYALDAFEGGNPPTWLTNGSTDPRTNNHPKIMWLGHGQPSAPVARRLPNGTTGIYVALATSNIPAAYPWGTSGSGVNDHVGLIRIENLGGGADNVIPKEWRELY